MKKFISGLLLSVLGGTLCLDTYAVSLKDSTVMQSSSFTFAERSNLTLANTYLSDLGNRSVKVNFQDITAKNAGTIIQSWKDPAMFPQKFVLERGLSVSLDPSEVDKKLVKINTVKQNMTAYQNTGIKVGTVNSELRMLPDRLQLFQTVQLTYRTDAQLAMIKKDIYTNSDMSTEVSALTAKNIKSVNQQVGSSASKLKSTGLSSLSALPETQTQLDQQATAELIKICKQKNGNTSAQCSEANVLQTATAAEKSITIEERLEFSLIPPTTIGGNFDFTKTKPSDVRISKSQISQVFQNYGIAKQIVSDTTSVPEAAATGSLDPLDQPGYCESKHSLANTVSISSGAVRSGGSSAANSSLINLQKCLDLQAAKKKINTEVYSQNLLNGFTLGEAQSYEWKARQSVDLWFTDVLLYDLSIRFYYSYGFGLRIPMQAKITIEDSTLSNHPSATSDYKIRIGLKTLDGDEGFYSSVGLDKSKIFSGKEFVLEVGAGIDIHAYVIGMPSIDVNIKLMSILATYFSDILVNDLGIPRSEIDAIIKDNKFDKGKNFTPPFAGSNSISLINASATVPIYKVAIFTLLAKLTIETSLSAKIKALCHNINSTGGCDGQELEFYTNTKPWTQLAGKWGLTEKQVGEGYKWLEFAAKAIYTKQGAKSDALGKYQNYGIVLDNFKYIPVLIVELFIQGGVAIGLPYVGSVELWTPKIKIFTMEFSSDDLYLGTHDGTNGAVSATANNRIYGTLGTIMPPFSFLTGSLAPFGSGILQTNDNKKSGSGTSIQEVVSGESNLALQARRLKLQQKRPLIKPVVR